ncbi:MAG: hypothetical protein HOP15_04550 [Planctomycetes bacterium]|nr:hypothetical protein [Planctomycetota bacterium]
MNHTLLGTRLLVVTLVTMAHASGGLARAQQELEHFAVIVNAGNPQNELSLNALRLIYLGQQRYWGSGKGIELVLNRAGSDEKKLLLSKVYDMTEAQLKKHWVELIYRNQISSPPSTYPSRETALQAVVRDPRAIALLHSTVAQGAASLKILRIDGRLPGQDGYPLTLQQAMRLDPIGLGGPASAQGARFARQEPEDEADTGGEETEGFEIIPRVLLRGFTHFELGARDNPAFVSTRESEGAFALGGLDLFLTSRLSERASFLNETVFEPTEDGEYVLDVERVIFKYEFGDFLNVQAGRFHTTIGYWNEAYHHGEWLQTSAGRPRILAFEDDGGLLPVHMIGLVFKGRHMSQHLQTDYSLELGNGRGPAADPPQITIDANDPKALNLGLTLHPLTLAGLSVGGSWYADSIPGNPDPLIGPVHTALDERIWSASLRYQENGWEALGEYFAIEHESSGPSADSDGYYLQISRQIERWTPYARYEAVSVDDADTFFADLDDLERWLLGVRWDFGDWSALKLQYAHADVTDDASGTQGDEDELELQLSFAF